VLPVGKNEYYVYDFQIFVVSVNYRALICVIDSKAIALMVAQNESFV
jgi:hypothetical protein